MSSRLLRPETSCAYRSTRDRPWSASRRMPSISALSFGHHGPTVAEGSQVLAGVEAERPGHSPAPGPPPGEAGPVCLRGVLDEGQPVPFGERRQGGHVRHLTEQVHDDHSSRPGADGRGHRVGVDQEGVGEHVDEPGRGAHRHDGLRRRDERVRRHDHLVARPDTQAGEDELESVRAVRDACAVAHLAVLGEGRLEGGDLGAADEPAVLEHRPPCPIERLAELGVHLRQVEEGDGRGATDRPRPRACWASGPIMTATL